MKSLKNCLLLLIIRILSKDSNSQLVLVIRYLKRKYVNDFKEIIMKRYIPDAVLKDITMFAERNSVNKVILFGSRARGTNTERSDIDLAVYGGDFDSFYWNINDNVNSLLSFDIINADKNISENLKMEIEKDGIVIYEKV